MNLRKAAEMALEVMEYNRANGTPNMGAAIEALRQALAQPEPKPLACDCDATAWCAMYKKCHRKMLGFEPFVALPQREWQGAQPEPKPLAWLEPEWGEQICLEVGFEHTITRDHPKDLCWIPLYTAPPKREWVGLTDEEIEECKINGGLPHAINWRLSVKVMEAKLKERNCGTS